MNISKVDKDNLSCYRIWQEGDSDFSFLVFEGCVFIGASDCVDRPVADLETSRAVLVAVVDFLWELVK